MRGSPFAVVVTCAVLSSAVVAPLVLALTNDILQVFAAVLIDRFVEEGPPRDFFHAEASKLIGPVAERDLTLTHIAMLGLLLSLGAALCYAEAAVIAWRDRVSQSAMIPLELIHQHCKTEDFDRAISTLSVSASQKRLPTM
jgi:hypothetical protein